jgi:hypothetical protein
MSKLNQAAEQASTAKKPATKVAKPAKTAKRKPGEPRGDKVEKLTANGRQSVQRPAPKPPAKAKAPAAPAKKAAPAKAAQTGAFGVVPGSFQEKLLAVLQKHLGKPVPMSVVLVAVYGPKRAKGMPLSGGPIQMVIGGIKRKAEDHGHYIVRSRNDAGPTLSIVKVTKAK